MFPAAKKKWVNLFKIGIIMITTRETTRIPGTRGKMRGEAMNGRLNKKMTGPNALSLHPT